MFSTLSSLWAGSLGTTTPGGSVQSTISSTVRPICDLDSQKDQRTRSLKHFLRLNHVENAMIYSHSYHVNTLPDILVAAYTLHLSISDLSSIFDTQNAVLQQWMEAPAEITTLDWMDHLGRPEYQRAYLDFFEDKVVEHGYDWQKVVFSYLFQNDTDLFARGLNAGGAPMVRLANALRTSSRELAIEALTLFAICPSSPDFVDARSWVATRTPSGSLNMKDALTSISKKKNPLCPNTQSVETFIEASWQCLHWEGGKALLGEMQQISLLLVQDGLVGRDSFGWLLLASHTLQLLSAYIPPTALILAQKEWWYHCVYAYAQAGCPTITNTAQRLDEISLREEYRSEIPEADEIYDLGALRRIQIQAAIREMRS